MGDRALITELARCRDAPVKDDPYLRDDPQAGRKYAEFSRVATRETPRPLSGRQTHETVYQHRVEHRHTMALPALKLFGR